MNCYTREWWAFIANLIKRSLINIINLIKKLSCAWKRFFTNLRLKRMRVVVQFNMALHSKRAAKIIMLVPCVISEHIQYKWQSIALHTFFFVKQNSVSKWSVYYYKLRWMRTLLALALSGSCYDCIFPYIHKNMKERSIRTFINMENKHK